MGGKRLSLAEELLVGKCSMLGISSFLGEAGMLAGWTVPMVGHEHDLPMVILLFYALLPLPASGRKAIKGGPGCTLHLNSPTLRLAPCSSFR